MGAAPATTSAVAALAEVRGGALARARAAVMECELCTRLRSHCRRVAREKKAAHRDDVYWGRPVPGFGDPDARVLIVGLAPAAHGANRTGRVFTGDGSGGSGDFLMRALHENGFASIPTSRNADDGLVLRDAYILTVVRCAPPDNKPAPAEISRCRIHLRAELAALSRPPRVVVALGKIAWEGYLAHVREERTRHPLVGVAAALPGAKPAFGHGVAFSLQTQPAITLLGSYHPSRQNTNTGRLTSPMLNAIFARARQCVADDTPATETRDRARE